MVIYVIEFKVRARTETVPWDVLKKSWLIPAVAKDTFRRAVGSS
jgi:hypothetical protein